MTARHRVVVERRLAAATDDELAAEAAATAKAAALASRWGARKADAAYTHLGLIHAEQARRRNRGDAA